MVVKCEAKFRRPLRGALRPLRFARALDLRSARLPSDSLRSSSAHVSRKFACAEGVRLTDEQSEELSRSESRKSPSAFLWRPW